ncbi:MAG: zf-HC2 domain-containing protein [Tenuifilaceae bacterium]
MKTNNNISNISEGCIPVDMLIKYIKGELSGLERNRIERHLSSCEMCSDELEGLSLLEKQEDFDSIVVELNTRIDKVIAEEKKEIPAWGFYFRIAASIVILLGISTIIYFTAIKNTPPTMVSDNLELQIPESKVSKESKKIESKGIAGVKKAEKQVVDRSEVSKKTAKPKIAEEEVNEVGGKYITPVIVDSISLDFSDELVAEAVSEEKMDTVIFAVSEVSPTRQVAEGAAPPAKAERLEKRKLISKESVSSFAAVSSDVVAAEVISRNEYNIAKETGTNLYNNKKYKEALSIYSKLYENFPVNDTVQFYTMMCNYHLNHNSEAINIFEKFIGQNNSAFYNEGKWYFALCLIKENNLSLADSILRTIIEENSPFTSDAKLKLESLRDSTK